MKNFTVLFLVGLTSAGAYTFGTRRLRLAGGGLRMALGELLECIGLALLFLAGNLTAGVMTGLTLRFVTQRFVSLYLADDVTLLVLSLFQGIVFHYWRRA